MKHRDPERSAPGWPASSPGRRVVQDHLLGALRAPPRTRRQREHPDEPEVSEDDPPA